MLNIQSALLVVILASSTLVSAHGHVASWTINGEKKAGFNPSSINQYGPTAERPTLNADQDWTSGVVACGGNSPGSGLETWDVEAGSTVTAHWNTWPDSHKGSITEYMARCPGMTCNGVTAESLDWFKIDEASFADGKWPTETLVSTLAWSFKIPSDLMPGHYLVRHDLLAMHTTSAPQVYPVCFQANLLSSGSAIPNNTVKFPQAYNVNPDFKTWNIYNGDQSAFVPPGPAVYGGSGSVSTLPAAPAPTSSSTSVPIITPAASTSTTSKAVGSTTRPVSDPSSVATPHATSSSKGVPPPPAPASSTPVTQPVSSGTLGGPAPPITKTGGKWIVNGNSYNFEKDAKYNSCMIQMNKCKDWANGLANAKVASSLTQCDAQVNSCIAGSKKREVMVGHKRRAARHAA